MTDARKTRQMDLFTEEQMAGLTRPTTGTYTPTPPVVEKKEETPKKDSCNTCDQKGTCQSFRY